MLAQRCVRPQQAACEESADAGVARPHRINHRHGECRLEELPGGGVHVHARTAAGVEQHRLRRQRAHARQRRLRFQIRVDVAQILVRDLQHRGARGEALEQFRIVPAHQVAAVGIEADRYARIGEAQGQRHQAPAERLPHQADAAEVGEAAGRVPAWRQRSLVEREIGGVLAQEEVAGRIELVDDGQQRRPRHHLQEARIQSGLARQLDDARAEQVVADRAAPARRHAERRRHPGHVPAGAAGNAAPAVLAGADQVGEGFAEHGEAGHVGHGHRVSVGCWSKKGPAGVQHARPAERGPPPWRWPREILRSGSARRRSSGARICSGRSSGCSTARSGARSRR